MLKRLEQERREAEHRKRDELRCWGGRPPSERLRRVRGIIYGIARLAFPIVDQRGPG